MEYRKLLVQEKDPQECALEATNVEPLRGVCLGTVDHGHLQSQGITGAYACRHFETECLGC